MVRCTNCGGEFEERLPSCPYCGQIYEPGAEQEYLRNIHKMQKEMSALPEESEKIYQKEVKGFAKKTGIIFGVLAAVMGIILSGFFLFSKAGDWYFTRRSMSPREELLWGNENFPKLDAWYEAGDYEAILEFRNQLYDTKEPHAYYSWKHSFFIDTYERYQECMRLKEKIQRGEPLSDYEAEDAVADSMALLFFPLESLYSDKEWQQFLLWQEDISDFLYGELKFSEEEAEALREKADDNGYINYDVCYEYGRKIKERFE